jgi:hypothetical protein
MSSARFQSVLLSPPAIFRRISSAEYRAIFSCFLTSCSPERNKPNNPFPFGPHHRAKSLSQHPDAYKAFLFAAPRWIREYWPAVKQSRRIDEIKRVLV